MRPDRTEIPWLGECLAARALARGGLAILGRRVQVGAIEVDLVARTARELVCVEVKTSLAREPGAIVRWRPAHRVDRERIRRQRTAGRRLCEHFPGLPNRSRCDVVEVWIDLDGKHFTVTHHRGIERPID